MRPLERPSRHHLPIGASLAFLIATSLACTIHYPVQPLDLDPVRAPYLATVRIAVVTPPDAVPDFVEEPHPPAFPLDIYRVEGIRWALRQTLSNSLSLTAAALDFVDEEPESGYDVLIWPTIDLEVEASGLGRVDLRAEIELRATDLEGRLLASTSRQGEQSFSANRPPGGRTVIKALFQKTLPPSIRTVVGALDVHFASNPISPTLDSEPASARGYARVDIRTQGLEALALRRRATPVFEPTPSAVTEQYLSAVADAFDVPKASIGIWDGLTTPGSPDAVGLRILVVSDRDELSVAALAYPGSDPGPTEQSPQIELASDYAARLVSIVTTGDDGPTTITAQIFEPLGTRQPAGTRSYAYRRRVEASQAWSAQARMLASTKVLHEMLAELVRDLRKEGVITAGPLEAE